MSAAQQGGALALDRLLDELAPYVRRLCARIAPAAADDATQEALLAVFRGLPSLRAPEAIMSWVRSVTVRTAIRLARQHDLEVAAEGTLMGRYASSLEGLVDIDDALARTSTMPWRVCRSPSALCWSCVPGKASANKRSPPRWGSRREP